jgi:four helix bundle protein
MAVALGLQPFRLMTEVTDGRKRILALHERALTFSNRVNQTYPAGSMNHPSRVVWEQLVRAADSASNNLIEADAASSRADFLNKMRIALREAKESRGCLAKIRMGPLANCERVHALRLEQEADELAAIFATIVRNAGSSTHARR